MKPVLVLEDDPAQMAFIRRALKQYFVLEASTAAGALQRFKGTNCNIGILIADVSLPVSSGIHLALLLRHKHRSLPVILTSEYPVNGWSEPDVADLARLQSDSVIILQKPLQGRLLLNAVQKLTASQVSARARSAS
jgi:CheY-like chemotaxis protein